MLRTRARLPFVGALVVVAVIAGVLLGNRVLGDRIAPHMVASPQAHVLPSLAELEARPLLPLVGPTNICAGSKEGPVEFKYPTLRFSGTKAEYASGQVFTYRGVEGLVLSRIRDARTGGSTIFYVNEYVAGALLGTDIVRGETVEMRPEVVFDTAHPRGDPDSIGRPSWTITWGWLPSHSDCTVIQTDGTYNGHAFVQFLVYEG